MSIVRLVCVGGLKKGYWREAADHYRKRLAPHVRFEEREVKDGAGKLPAEERSRQEGERILATFRPEDLPICLDERGKEYDSRGFADYLGRLLEDGNRVPCFIVGGPFGLSDQVRGACQGKICLGRLTMPHDLARVVFMEQLYRAVSILKGSPYHH